ncbi:MAG: pyrroline-5-carboxylate reductase [Nitrospiraceae bacterium]
MLRGKQIALIGGGNMTEALVVGLIKGGLAIADQIHATDILPARRSHLQDRYRIRVGSRNAEAAAHADVVILSVEPQVLDEVLDGIAAVILAGTLIISVAAGYPIRRVATHLKQDLKIIRAMPNTPSSVSEGITALTLGAGVTADEARMARAIFESVGKVVEVEERLMDAATGLSGSGPAYVYVMIEALADGGVKMGLPRPVAELLAAQTILGAARMVLETGEHPGRLKDRVASPGGTTIAGLHALETGRLRATLISAVEAATKRSQELGQGE